MSLFLSDEIRTFARACSIWRQLAWNDRRCGTGSQRLGKLCFSSRAMRMLEHTIRHRTHMSRHVCETMPGGGAAERRREKRHCGGGSATEAAAAVATRRAPALRRLESGGKSDDDGAMAVLETAAAFKCATVTAGTCTCLLRRAAPASPVSPAPSKRF